MDELCTKHARLYVYDKEYNWFRKKKRLDGNSRRKENNQKYHSNERKLGVVLKKIFGVKSVISAVHPIWAKSSKGALLEFDFAIPSKKILIERDGLQHVEYPNYFHRTRKQFNEQQSRDKHKRQIAKEEGWNVVTIDHNIKVNLESIQSFLDDVVGDIT